jgi:hypothetical protein
VTGSGKLVSQEIRLASGRQLWRLNQLGRLAVVAPHEEPITVADAGRTLKQILKEDFNGRTSFP